MKTAYTSIKKSIDGFDILISDNPHETNLGFNRGENLFFKNMVRIYCQKDGYYATFVSSKEMMKYEPEFDSFCLKNIKRIFENLKKELITPADCFAKFDETGKIPEVKDFNKLK